MYNRYMNLSDKIRSLAGFEQMTLTALAQMLGMSKQNLNRKLKSNAFTEEDIAKICKVFDADYEITFITKDGMRF